MDTLKSTLSSFKGVAGMAFAGWLPFTQMYVPAVDLHGRTALVSGANVGIGYECAMKLAQFGASVWLLCRDPVKAEAARTKLVEATGNANITVAIVDFGSLTSVRNFVESWDPNCCIDIIINNAGIVSGRYLKTAESHEITYQTNILSHVVLTLMLLPHLAHGARIVNVASHGQYTANRDYVDPDDMDSDALLSKKMGFREGDDLPAAVSLALYAKTKALQAIFARQLQRRLCASTAYTDKCIAIHSCHPGLVKSGIWTHSSSMSAAAATLQRNLARIVSIFGTTCEQGACTPVFLATAPETAGRGGGYWDRMSERTPSVLVLDDVLGDRLWEAWMASVGLGVSVDGL